MLPGDISKAIFTRVSDLAFGSEVCLGCAFSFSCHPHYPKPSNIFLAPLPRSGSSTWILFCTLLTAPYPYQAQSNSSSCLWDSTNSTPYTFTLTPSKNEYFLSSRWVHRTVLSTLYISSFNSREVAFFQSLTNGKTKIERSLVTSPRSYS